MVNGLFKKYNEGEGRMLLALVGVTGVGKSYYKDLICSKLNFKRINTIRTRAIRKNEEAGKSGLFFSKEELDKIEAEGKLAYRFGVFGGEYGYLKDEVYSDDDYVFEMHYTTIYDWKKVRPDIKTIYILPSDIEIARAYVKSRNLPPEKEIERLKEMDEHYNRYMNDEDLRNQFDYVIYNNYDENSANELLQLVEKIRGEIN